MLQTGQAETPPQGGPNAPLAKIAQPLPIPGEIPGQEENQQDFDQLHGLKRPEVDFGIADTGSLAETEQQAEQREGRQQGDVAPVGQPAVIEQLESRQGQEEAAQEN